MAISTGCSITVCSACLVTRSGSSASGGRPGNKNTMCRTCRPMPPSRRSLPRSRPGGSVNRPISSSRRSLGSTTSKVDPGRDTSTRADDDDRLRLPPIPPPQSSGTEKKKSQDRHHNQACRPSGKQSSTSSHDLHPDTVLTVTGYLQILPSHPQCQSSASPLAPAPQVPRATQ